jgi:hypothetical protein
MKEESPVRKLIRRHVAPQELDTLVRVSFEVPDSVERLEISVRKADRAASIRFGLYDQNGLRGLWSGEGAVKFLTRECASPGFERGPIVPGTWSVGLLPTRLGEPGCDVQIELAFNEKRFRWLKGDLHLHTDHSDGLDSPTVVVDRCRAMGLDFIALTDHDARTGLEYLPYRPDFLVIPGIELSSARGHANCIGVDRPYTNGMFATEADVRAALDEARDKGCFVSINHAFDWDPGCQWRWSWDVPFDGLEVVNGPWRPTNARAIDWWQALLCRGERLAVVGGSDSHTCFELTLAGMPTTWVWAEEASRESIVAALKRGNCLLTMTPKGPEIRLGGHVPGETLRVGRGSRVAVPVDLVLNPGTVIRIVTAAGQVLERKAESEEMHIDFEMKVEADDFLRVEAWEYMEEYDRSMLTLLTNPVYLRVDD